MKFFIILLAITALSIADELADCKCNEGYAPKKDDTGNVSCYGSILKDNFKSILPCNILTKPTCICSVEATSVVQDPSGTWCGKFSEDKKDRRWPCENKEEWEAFYKKHPEEKPKR
ncbi:hypothetical protein NQ314_013497 [Rhamnusium bicolor]|uniref:Uncharacterized protein n=1 Tax=Rhamnusium bicolor TaxID=1586634 RepID=A0AAV8X6J0_9CUCU|nr:hypothetical protein NQ314_013497 [Rhamnusium bicolor]